MAIIEISKRKRSHHQLGFVPYVSVSKTDHRMNKTQIVISINRDAMRDLRWVTGDKVRVTFDDETHLITLTRTGNHDGYTLSGKINGKASKGNIISSSIRITARGIINPTEFIGIDKEDCVVDGVSITFVMPGQN